MPPTAAKKEPVNSTSVLCDVRWRRKLGDMFWPRNMARLLTKL